MAQKALIRAGDSGLTTVVNLWAEATTDPESPRRLDLIRDKMLAVTDFFSLTGKAPGQVTPIDVKLWQAQLETETGKTGKPLAPATVYAKLSRLSSFYKWAIESEEVTGINHNPVDLARPKAPKPYQTEQTKALTDSEVIALLQVVKSKADSGDVVGKRDLALILLFLTTGMRRREVIQLKWGNVKINSVITFTTKVKGGVYVTRELNDPSVKAALLDYLYSSGRFEELTPDSPLWTAHDRTSQNTGKPLTSHAFVKNLKRYAKEAGLGNVHLHQTRHTYARIVAEETGSIIETQDALGHKNAATTRVYVQRVGVKRDKHSSRIAQRFGLGEE